MDYNINFPHLHIFLKSVGKTIEINNFAIAYYGIVIVCGMLAGIALACFIAKKTGQNPDDYYDLAIYAIVFSVIGARLYYVAFRWDLYKNNPLEILNIRNGGLGIYGGVIVAMITTFVFAKVKKLSFPLLCDTAGLGLILGQAIGRWGNFFNREAFGGYTNNLFAMQLPINAVRSSDLTQKMLDNTVTVNDVVYVQVHPTFLYESVWNLCLLVLLLLFFKHKKFDGQVFTLYLLGYGVGRFWIESLRTDQLIIPVINYPISMALAATLSVVAILINIYMMWIRPSRKNKEA
ncbi:phosphatidylglycerol:prolipoprotein diacylglycerol transferase [Lachnospiraceae bacterium C7]|nr:phosphatidylglycerol:prolipoprotein diacylglycerol transferase [Lachnospiraceae bacterium C7]